VRPLPPLPEFADRNNLVYLLGKYGAPELCLWLAESLRADALPRNARCLAACAKELLGATSSSSEPETPIVSANVRPLWCVTIKGLLLSDSCSFEWHVVPLDVNADAVSVKREVYRRFSKEWWEEHIVTDIEKIGSVHVLDGVCLYDTH
jgi:hypothetical protein